jgi:hypothetical protein
MNFYGVNYTNFRSGLVIHHERPGFLWHLNVVISPEALDEFLIATRAVMESL